MKNHASTIDLKGSDLPRRLRELRGQRRLSQADLADKAGLSYRTVHDLEAGRRDRILEKTVMLLATALEVPLQDLTPGYDEADGGTTTAPRFDRRRMIGIVVLVMAALAITGLLVWRGAVRSATWEFENTTLTARDGYFGIEIWTYEAPDRITLVKVAPWRAAELLLGLSWGSTAGGRLVCLDRATGAWRWEVGPDLEAIEAAFGQDIVRAGNFACQRIVPVDLDVDGQFEVVADFIHNPYYPNAVCLIDHTGRLLKQYALKGHVADVTVTDLDADGRPELLIVGTNNSKQYQGAMVTLLDQEHFAGATVDSLCECPGWGQVPDSSRVRVVLPALPKPYMKMIEDVRLNIWQVKIIPGQGGGSEVNFETGSWNNARYRFLVTMDRNLRPRSADATDAFLIAIEAEWPDSIKHGTGPADPEWRQAWLDGYVRFEVGRYER